MPPQRPLFLFSFVAPDSHLWFRTLLVIANASCAVLSFGFLLYLRPAAVRVSLAHFVGFCSDVDLLCSTFYLLSGWACLYLVGCLLAGTALLSQSHDVPTMTRLLGFQMSMYSESYGY